MAVLSRILQLSALLCVIVAVLGYLGRWMPYTDIFNMVTPLTLVGILLFGSLALLTARGKRRFLIVALLLGGSLVTLQMLPELRASRTIVVDRSARPLRVLVWNTYKENFDLVAAIALIRDNPADIVALQEANGNVGLVLNLLKPYYPYHSSCSKLCEFAILSRRPITQEQRWKPGAPPWKWVKTSGPDGKPIRVINVHFPHVDHYEYQAMLKNFLHMTGTARTIVVGDMNLAPWTYSMRRQDELLRPMQRLTHALPTWPAHVFQIATPFAFLPIDHIYVGETWRSGTVRALPLAGSDHHALLADIDG